MTYHCGDIFGRIDRYNPDVWVLFGKDPEDLIRKSLANLVHASKVELNISEIIQIVGKAFCFRPGYVLGTQQLHLNSRLLKFEIVFFRGKFAKNILRFRP